MSRVAHNEDPDQIYSYIGARADLADRQAEIEATDPEEWEARRREQGLIRALIAMVLVIVGGGFTIGIIGLIVIGTGAR